MKTGIGPGTVLKLVAWAFVFVQMASGSVSEGMVLVEGGTCNMSMGNVTIDAFYMGRCEVTWDEWQEVRTWAVANGYDIGGVGAGCADNHPVQDVNWYDVVKWCNAKSEKEGLTPVYTVSGANYKRGQTIPQHNQQGRGYRLPLEAEWEFAARGGNQTHGYIYSGSNQLNAVGWYDGNSTGAACDLNSGSGTWPVGQKNANELGLHDMSGNVWEWCWDPTDFSARRIRGGSWYFGGTYGCPVSIRSMESPSMRANDYGFRVAHKAVMWGQYRIKDGYADTTPFMGWLNVESAPWVWCYGTQCWYYISDACAEAGEGWIYSTDLSKLETYFMPPTNWGWSFKMNKWVYVDGGAVSGNGWVYVP